MKAVAWFLAAVMACSGMPVTGLAAAGDKGTARATGLVLETTLTDNQTVKGRKKTFEVWARDSLGNTVHPSATFDGVDLMPTWEDDVKTSFTLDFEGKEEGAYELILYMYCDEGEKELTYTINYEQAQPGEFLGNAVVSVEGFTISQGYLIEPTLVPIYEGENAAIALARLIRESGYDLEYTGDLESNFYISYIVGSNADDPMEATEPLELTDVEIEPNILVQSPELADMVGFDSSMGETGKLGEFCYCFASGWMVCVNGDFLNVGASDCYLSDGDVMRWQFTIDYGMEIGGASALGGGMEDLYPVADKDELTRTLAHINSAPNSEQLKSDPDIAAAIEQAHEVLKNIPVDQDTVDQADGSLKELLQGTVTSITLDQTELELQNDSSVVLTPEITYDGNTAALVEWSSDNLAVAKVVNGTVTAAGAGTATITATCGGKSQTCQVTVPEAPLTDISLDVTELSLLKNQIHTLTPILNPANTTDDRTVTWTSTDDTVARVSAEGIVVAMGEGDAVITAAVGSYTASCTVHVEEKHIESISLSKTELEVAKGSGKSLSVVYTPSDHTDSKTVEWSSSDTTVATVSGGYVRGVKAGTAVIKAVVNGTHEASCTVNVIEYPLTGVELSYYTYSVKKGSSSTLYPSYLPSNTTDEKGGTWTSSNPDVATVSGEYNGQIRGISEGTTLITFTSKSGGYQASCLVGVTNSYRTSASSLTLDKTEVSLLPGGTAELTATRNTNATDPVLWKSGDTNVVTVQDGVLQAVALGETEVTAYAGNRSVTCKVTVSGPKLSALSMVNGTGASAAEYALTPVFSPDTKNYKVRIPDYVTTPSAYAKATLADMSDGGTGSITARYITKSGSGTEKTVSLTSGKATGTNLSLFFQSDSLEGNTLHVDLAARGLTDSYQIDVERELTLSSLSASLASQNLSLTPAFSKDVTEYTVSVPDSCSEVFLEAGAYSAAASVSVNGQDAAQGKTGIALPEDSATAVVKAVSGEMASREYTVTFRKVPSAKLRLSASPADAVMSVRDAGGNVILPENGAYTLIQGADYTLKATKSGYVGTKETFQISADTDKTVTLTEAAPSTLRELPAEWKNFRNSDVNMGITSAKTPKTALTTYLKWSQFVGKGWGSNAVGTPIIVDNAIFVMQSNFLKKYDKETGELLKSVEMEAAHDYGYTPPTYAAGMIFVPIHGKVQAFNAETMESLWVYTDELGGQALSPVTYADGYIYTGFWNSEEKKANYVCISVTDEDPNQTAEEKLSTWEYTSAGGFYWAGSLVRGDSVIFGTDDGASGSDGTSHMLSLNRYTGKVQDSLELTGDQRSSVSYDEKTKRIWFTTKGGYLYSAVLKENGTFDHASLKSLQVGGMSTSTPMVYNGRVYVGVSSGGNFSGKFGVNVIDAETMSVIYSAELQGYPQCSVLLSNAYEKEEDGTVYIYATYNNNPGGISLIRDKAGQTAPDIEEIFVPESPEYCISSIICDTDGTLYYKNDSGCLFAVAGNTAYLTGASVDVEGAVMDGGEAFAGSKASHEIVVPVSTESITLSLTASEGSEISVNEEQGTSFQLPVGSEASEVTVKVTKGSEWRNYTFRIRKQRQDASLADLKVGTSNGYNSFLTLTPDFDNDTAEYRAEHKNSISFLRLWLRASDENAVIRVYPEGDAGRTDIAEDGTIPVTGGNGANRYRAIYFADGRDCARVRIEVTAEDGETTKTFYVSMKQQGGNTPVIQAGENAAVHTDNEEGTLTFMSNEYGKAYYQFVEEGGAAPSDVDVSGDGTNVEVGENTIDLTGLKKQGGTLYLVVKDQDTTPHISNMLAVPVSAYVGPEDGVIEQIQDIQTGEDGLPDAESVENIREAYNALSDVQKSRVTNYAKLVEAEKALVEAEKNQVEAESLNKDRAAAQAVTNAIAAIGEVTSLDKSGEVAAVRAVYDSLSEAQKELVTNLSVLTEAEEQIRILTETALEQAEQEKAEQERQEALKAQAAPVSEAIAAIGTVSLDSEAAIQAAADAYEALTDEAKAKVENYAALVIARKDLEILKAQAESQNKDAAAAQAVQQAIEAIGEVTALEQKGEVAAVRAVYESLSEAQKELVTNLSVLAEAEEKILGLTAEAEEQAKAEKTEQERQEALKEQAAPVIAAIAAIKTVSLDSEASIQAAVKAYAALSDEAKAKVENYVALVIAQKDLEILKAEQKKTEPEKPGAQDEKPGASDKTDIREGQTYVSGKFSFKVLSNQKRTVSVAGLSRKNLKKVVIPAKVTLGGQTYQIVSIEAKAFAGCKNLKNVKISSKKLTEIGSKAFHKCRNLAKITIKSKKLQKVGKNAFKGTSKKLTIKVPASRYKVYKKYLAKKGQSRTARIKK